MKFLSPFCCFISVYNWNNCSTSSLLEKIHEILLTDRWYNGKKSAILSKLLAARNLKCSKQLIRKSIQQTYYYTSHFYQYILNYWNVKKSQIQYMLLKSQTDHMLSQSWMRSKECECNPSMMRECVIPSLV